ncbi:dimethylmenaquinone methyltransferase (plasmid) [Ensifer adhaerens]|uniref:Putative 4-hydroxy-4-methyl-2-oxoglutarate aldolase n=1 Tax=Ensifer adhaerens TaxID=106592 RepID=A0ABY8HLJ8_ENSAD|nr:MULTISPECIES: RraA family protein [Ensifer]ANK75851.1 dimethylmenaquinone methyltransferase [Ensifer adhaerens]KDP72371.1 dimethylmenaquinone methyltransferase [Ensifer adhaerens]MBD9541640.1 RraA family protein [Ensifer sp. ENS04]WFP93003.1 RraA family protein [Ensifer adhaerens]SFH03526.1 Regulator of RNase E activity RraA [Ensifer sp. OV372]
MSQPYKIEKQPEAIPDALRTLLEGVETATIGHFEYLGFVGAGIAPVFPAKAIGTAVTVAAPSRDGAVIYTAIDLLRPGDVLVISRVDRDDVACVGGGVVAAARARGAVAIIVDGPCTDIEEIGASRFPIWCRGVSSKTTSRRHQIGGAINVPIACGGAAVLPGYAVLADTEGVFVADPSEMRCIADVALERQQRSLKLRPYLEAGHSIFELDRII